MIAMLFCDDALTGEPLSTMKMQPVVDAIWFPSIINGFAHVIKMRKLD
jgi:hypothetical protein